MLQAFKQTNKICCGANLPCLASLAFYDLAFETQVLNGKGISVSIISTMLKAQCFLPASFIIWKWKTHRWWHSMLVTLEEAQTSAYCKDCPHRSHISDLCEITAVSLSAPGKWVSKYRRKQNPGHSRPVWGKNTTWLQALSMSGVWMLSVLLVTASC